MPIEYDEFGNPIDPELIPNAGAPYYPPTNVPVPAGYELRNGVVSADLGRTPVASSPELDATRGPGRFITVPTMGGNAVARYSDNPDYEEMLARGMNVDKASKAIQAAMQFQGMRAYARDIDEGMSPVEALARNAGSLLGSRGGLGGLAALARAQVPPSKKFLNIGGGGYVYDPTTESVQTVVPPQPKAPPTSQKEKDLHAAYLAAQKADAKAYQEFKATPESNPYDWQEKRNALNATERILKDARTAYEAVVGTKTQSATPPAASIIAKPTMYSGPAMGGAAEDAMIAANRAGGAPMAPAAAANEVIRVVKGRSAVFDAVTKKFIRWVN